MRAGGAGPRPGIEIGRTVKHRKPSRTQRAVANSSLPLATAAAVATFFASPAGAVPNEQPTTPNTPGPSQPGTTDPEASPQTPGPGQQNQRGQQNQQPGVQTPDGQGSRPTPSQPGVTTPQQEPGDSDSEQKPEQGDQQLAAPTQPGVTTPRVAPLPVPGQPDSAQPAIHKDREPGDRDRDQAPGRPDSAEQGDEQAVTPRTGESEQAAPNSGAVQPETQAQVQPEYTAPRNQAAPPAPVVEMAGPHAEVGAAVDGGSLVPGHVANTHHFRNEAGYVGTAGYSTPEGAGEAGVSVEFLDENSVQVSSFIGGEGLPDNQATHMIDTTGLNTAKAAVEHWIAAQPGGPAAMEAAANYEPPQLIPEGDAPPQTVNVGGVNTQWGGSLQY